MVIVDPLDQEALRVNKVLQEKMAVMENQAQLDQEDPLVSLVKLVLMENLAETALMVFLVHLDCLA